MSTKRILGITLFGILFILTVVGIMLLTSFLRRDNEAIQLPDISTPTETPAIIEPDALDRVEVTRETIQAVVSDLSRPRKYSRDVIIESLWEGDLAVYNISVSVMDGYTSLRTTPPLGIEKRIIITPDTLYIWYKGDNSPYIGSPFGEDNGFRTADEWQMLATYEDVLRLDQSEIIDAGYVEFGGMDCVYAEYLTPMLRYTGKYYISLELGLVVGAEEYDESGKLVYSMTSGECLVDEADPAEFVLPDGMELVHHMRNN